MRPCSRSQLVTHSRSSYACGSRVLAAFPTLLLRFGGTANLCGRNPETPALNRINLCSATPIANGKGPWEDATEEGCRASRILWPLLFFGRDRIFVPYIKRL